MKNAEASTLNGSLALRMLVSVFIVAMPSLARSEPANAVTPTSNGTVRAIRVMWIGATAPEGFAECVASWFPSHPTVAIENGSSLQISQSPTVDHEATSRVWVDMRQAPHVRVYFSFSPDGQTVKYLVHDAELDDGLSELGSERLAQMIYSSLLALKEGRAQSSWSELERNLGPSEAQTPSGAEPPSTTPNPLPPPQSSLPRDPIVASSRRSSSNSILREEPTRPAPAWHWHLAAATGYGASLRENESVAHGPMLWSMIGRGNRAFRVGAFVSGRYLVPVEPEAQGVIVRLNGFQLRMGGAVEWALSNRSWVSIGAGLGLDEIQARPRTSDTGKRALDGGWDERAVGTTFVAVLLPTAIGTVYLLGELGVLLQPSHYDLTTKTGGREELLSASRLQPGLALQMRFDTTAP